MLQLSLGLTVPTLSTKETQTEGGRREGDMRPLGKVEYVAGRSVDGLSGGIRNIEFARHDDLHLVVRVRVMQRRTDLLSIESRRDRFFRICAIRRYKYGL